MNKRRERKPKQITKGTTKSGVDSRSVDIIEVSDNFDVCGVDRCIGFGIVAERESIVASSIVDDERSALRDTDNAVSLGGLSERGFLVDVAVNVFIVGDAGFGVDDDVVVFGAVAMLWMTV